MHYEPSDHIHPSNYVWTVYLQILDITNFTHLKHICKINI